MPQDPSELEALPPGPTPQADQRTAFKVWAPRASDVVVEILREGEPAAQSFSLDPLRDGWFGAVVEPAVPGNRYHYRLDGGEARPDPVSLYQPDGVHGPSEIPFPPEPGPDRWEGRARGDLVVYEIHIGTYTLAGTWEGATARLEEIVALGATAVEILPVAEAPGRWNWGYDGVDLYAPNHNYGRPEAFRAFVDACHAHGLAVILDVVYNHLGPEGNYLAEFAPWTSKRHGTPWGPALNFDEPGSGPVRDAIVGNALYWIREFRLDGLRLDAIRLMQDDSELHIVHEIATAVRRLEAELGRPLHLIAEANVYDQPLLDAGYDLVWNDEAPHALGSVLLGQSDIDGRTYRGACDVRTTLDRGYLYHRVSNDPLPVRSEGVVRGDLAAMLQGLQTHDQIGNHPEGLRFHQLTSPETQRAAAALILLHPAVPFIFMGEEFAAPSPFCFFVDFGDPRLRRAVVRGRKRDYAHHDWTRFESPLEETAFLRSKLPPPVAGDAETLRWYRDLIRLRAAWREEEILRADTLRVTHEPGPDVFGLHYPTPDGGAVSVFSQLAGETENGFAPGEGEILLQSAGCVILRRPTNRY